MEKIFYGKKILINKNLKQKILIIGMPTIGKTTFYKSNKNISWDSDFLYKLIASINNVYIDAFKNEKKLFSEIFPYINKQLIQSEKIIILHSIIGKEYLDQYNYFLSNNYQIIFVTRKADDYLNMWKKRHQDIKDTIYNPTLMEANGCINLIKEISKIIKCKVIELNENQFLTDIIEIKK